MMRIHQLIFLGLTPALLAAALFAPESSAQETLPDSVYTSDGFQLGDGEPGDAESAAGTPGTANIVSDELRPGLDWADLFDGTGARFLDYVNPATSQMAVFITDDTSSDTTTLVGGMVSNGTVATSQDLHRAYVYTTLLNGKLVLFAGAERLTADAGELEFEFNQAHVRLGRGGYGRGEPWEIVGNRTLGDLRVKLTLGGPGIFSLTVEHWDSAGSWAPFESIAAEGCNGDETVCTVCNEGEILGGPWSASGIPSLQFVEFGVNVDAVVGMQPAFNTIQMRTPEDIAFGYFADGN
jgi:hypothetical protein